MLGHEADSGGDGDGVCVGDGAAEGVGVGLGEGVGERVAVGVRDGIGVCLGDGVGVDLSVGVGDGCFRRRPCGRAGDIRWRHVRRRACTGVACRWRRQFDCQAGKHKRDAESQAESKRLLSFVDHHVVKDLHLCRLQQSVSAIPSSGEPALGE